MNQRGFIGADRGQLLVVVALIMAVLFVTLALVVNGAIYSENLSSRADSETGETLVAVDDTFDTVDTVLDRANADSPASYDEATRSYLGMLHDWRDVKTSKHADRGTSFALTTTNQTNGTYIQQTDQSRNFTSATAEANDWQLASGAGGVSDYRMVVNRASLYNDTGDILSDLLANSFSLHVTDENGKTWEVHVYENTDGNVAVRPVVDGVEQTPCEVDAAEVEIDLVNGTVGGAPCPTLSFAEGLDGTLDIEYRDPDKVTGSYELRVDVVIDPATNSHYVEPGSGSPSATPNVYSSTLRFTFARSDRSFETTRRVVAGEPSYLESA